MPEITQILRTRKRRHKQAEDSFLHPTALGLTVLISMVAVFLGLVGTLLYARVTEDLPSIDKMPLLLNPTDGMLLQPTRFYDRSGEHIILALENPAVEERRYLPLASQADENEAVLPPTLIEGTIAIVDPDFWEHAGFTDLDLSNAEEHETIAQQLVADLLLWGEAPNRRRAARERILAAQLTSRFGRENVLAWYLNSAYFGNQTYGADAAAQVYFGKSAADLSIAEAAMLAGVVEAPSINPHDAPDEAIRRAHAIIEALAARDILTGEEAEDALAAEITFREKVAAPEPIAEAFTNLVWEQLEAKIPVQRLEAGGFEIVTTLDYDLQVQANCATEIHLARLKGEEVPSTESQSCQAARLLPSLSLDQGTSVEALRANVIILDPHTGEILTFINESPREVVTAHPAGTALSPFIYLTAFTRGFHPASLLWDIPAAVPDPLHPITNPMGEFQGPMRLRTALANDYLIPAITTMQQVGADNVWRTAENFGLEPPATLPDDIVLPECPSCQYLFEGNPVTLLKLAQAYGALANQGFFVGDIHSQGDDLELQSRTIRRIDQADGRTWQDEQPYDKQALTSMQLAYLLTHILSDESARWQSMGHPNPLEIGRPAAAKLGRTNEGDDVWTMGYTPQLVVGIWAGREAQDSLEGGSLPSETASALWHAIIQYATSDLPAENWDAPLGISTMAVCDPSGMLPTGSCPSVVNEVFLSGQEPTQVDTLYRNYEINRETGRLATVFTPPELIEEKVFLLVPPEASAWARDAGIPTPPESYDVIAAPEPAPDARITRPEMFSIHRGEISVMGSATGEDFVSYRLQVGQGLNPQTWLAITEDVTTPVEDDELGVWDASDTDGLYALQLIVLRGDQQIDTDTIQVTIDNQAPLITIDYPQDGQTLSRSAHPTITFQVTVQENLELEGVSYFIDGEAIGTQDQAPFAYSWQATPGEHTLRVEAVDLAGNSSEAAITFLVE
jgi:membrane peptidoglycan carboxypeptidase